MRQATYNHAMNHITITARVKERQACDVLEQMGEEWGILERRLFVEKHARGKLDNDATNALKRRWLKEHGLTSSQFNALDAQVRGKLLALEESVKLSVEGLNTKIAKVKAELKKKLDRYVRHQKNRRLATLKARLANLEARKKNSICFGSRTVFRAQFHLQENGYKNHGEWLADWRETRSSQTFCLGNAAEKGGNASCTMLDWNGEQGNLRVRRFGSHVGEFVTVPIRFTYMTESLDRALRNKRPVTYRFCKKDKKWYVHASVERNPVPVQTDEKNGLLGVDLNINHVSCARISSDGNLKDSYDVKLGFKEGDTGEQRKAKIYRVVARLVKAAVEHKTPIVIETLDF